SEVTVTCGRLISTASRLVFLWTIPVFPFPISVSYLVVPCGCRHRMAAGAGPTHASGIVPPAAGESLTAWWIPRPRRRGRPRGRLDQPGALPAAVREAPPHLRARLVAVTGRQVLVLGGPARAVGQLQVGQPVPEPLDHLQRVVARGRRVGEVDGDVGVLLIGRVVVRQVVQQLPHPQPPRVHALHGDRDAVLL